MFLSIIKIKKNRLVGYSLPPKLPKIAKRAKNNATGNIPITVHAVSLASLHSVLPRPVGLATDVAGQSIAVDTSLKIRIPMSSATAAPMNANMKPIESMIYIMIEQLFKRQLLFLTKCCFDFNSPRE